MIPSKWLSSSLLNQSRCLLPVAMHMSMISVIAPAMDGLKKQWREASENLGASAWQYWRFIGLPILTPALLSMFILLFFCEGVMRSLSGQGISQWLAGGETLLTLVFFRHIYRTVIAPLPEGRE